jgi:hypothetical protein
MAQKIKTDIVERNIRLTGKIMEYMIDHPQIFKVLPDDFELVILPEDDPEIGRFKLDLLNKLGRRAKPIVFARVRTTARTIKPSIFVPVAA